MYQFLLLGVLSFLSVSLFAQSDDVVEVGKTSKITVQEAATKEKDDTEKPSNSKGVEKIEVTGSYVRRIDIEGPSPVVTINKEDFENAGIDTVSDYLKESPLFGGSSDSGDRDGYFRFRGQHAGSTLVLLNGMRIPKLGGTSDRGFFNGVEGIPTNIIDRVEVLKDGSSALYGSDAMAGVMNFITKKNYDGVEYSNRINIPEINRGLQQNHSLAFGQSFSRGSWFATTQFVEQRGYTEADVGNFFQNTQIVGPASKGNYTVYNDGQAQNFKASESFDPQCADPDANCEVDTRAINYVREPRQNIGTMVSGQIDINSDMQLNMVGMYNRRMRTDLGQPGYINIDNSTNKFLKSSQLGSPELQAKANGAGSMTLAYQPYSEVGNREVDVLQNAYMVQSQLDNYFGDTWKWQLGGSYGYTLEERTHTNGLLDVNKVIQEIEGGYNPLNIGAQNNGALDSAQVVAIEAYEASLATARFLTTGEVFDFSDLYGMGGPFSIAVGVEGQWEQTADVHDDILLQSTYNRQFLNEEGSRNINSVFTEFVMYPLQSVEFQAAGRLDNYSDWGATFNPKFSLGYRPSNKVLLRSSWGTNFNAPALRNMIAAEVNEYPDLEFTPDGSKQFDVPTVRYVDPNLRPETGVNYNFGTVIQPNKQWTFTIDQWNFIGQDTITRFSSSAYNRAYETFANDPSADKRMEDLGVFIERDQNDKITSVRMPHVFNMGDRTIRGLDIGTKFFSPVRLFGRVLKFGFNFDHTHMLVYKTKAAPTLPVSYRTDLEWKNNLNFNIKTERHSYRLAARTLAGDTGQSSIRTHTEYDLNYGYKIPWWAAKLQLGVKNLLNSRPPVPRDEFYVDFTDGYNSYAFNSLGRRYYVGYSQSF